MCVAKINLVNATLLYIVRARKLNKKWINSRFKAVGRAAHLIVAFAVCAERTLEILHKVINESPRAKTYCTDSF